MKMDEDDAKENGVYFMEDKNEDELFEVLELDVDDMEDVEVDNEHNESYRDETIQENVGVKCETITSK